MNFFFEKIPSIFDIENWLWKYDFGTFWQAGAPHILKIQHFPLSMLILGQEACILGPTIFKIPQPNWHYCLWMSSIYSFFCMYRLLHNKGLVNTMWTIFCCFRPQFTLCGFFKTLTWIFMIYLLDHPSIMVCIVFEQ